MDEVLRKADIEVTKDNRERIDEVLHRLAGTRYKNCPATWKEIKTMMKEDEASLVKKIGQEFNKP